MRLLKADRVGIIIVGILCLILLLNSSFRFFYSGNGIETVGIVKEVNRYSHGSRYHSYYAHILYNVDGKDMTSEFCIEKTFKRDYKPEEFDVNKEVDIYYYKYNPEIIGNKGVDKKFFEREAPFIIIGIILWIVFIVDKLFRKKDRLSEKKLKERGEMIYASYVKTICARTEYSDPTAYPYFIYCEWINPENNERCVFRSDYIETKTNPETIIQERGITKFPVYINKNKITEYFVDISEITENIDD